MAPLHPETRATSRSTGGFTLIELMIVVILMGLVGAVAMISWQALIPNQELNTAVRNLSEVLYGSRNDAIARNREFRIYYDLDAEEYRVRTPFRPDGGGFALSDEEPHLWISETDLTQSGVSLDEITIDDRKYTSGTVYVIFDPLGNASNHTIVLTQELFRRSFTIEVLPLTGDIRFHDGVYEREPADENDFDR
jgi:type II secretion system protein H